MPGGGVQLDAGELPIDRHEGGVLHRRKHLRELLRKVVQRHLYKGKAREQLMAMKLHVMTPTNLHVPDPARVPGVTVGRPRPGMVLEPGPPKGGKAAAQAGERHRRPPDTRDTPGETCPHQLRRTRSWKGGWQGGGHSHLASGLKYHTHKMFFFSSAFSADSLFQFSCVCALASPPPPRSEGISKPLPQSTGLCAYAVYIQRLKDC